MRTLLNRIAHGWPPDTAVTAPSRRRSKSGSA
jgi:hypothetical protein